MTGEQVMAHLVTREAPADEEVVALTLALLSVDRVDAPEDPGNRRTVQPQRGMRGLGPCSDLLSEATDLRRQLQSTRR